MPYSPPLMPISTRPLTTRGACVIVRLALVAGDHAPHRLAGARVERDQASIERADVDLAFPGRDAAADDVAAALHAELARHFRIVGPDELAGRGVVRLDHAPRGRDVHHAIDDERRRLLSTIGVEVRIPREAELLRIVRRYLGQRTEALLAVGSPVAQPIRGVAICVVHACGIDVGRRVRGMRLSGDQDAKDERDRPNGGSMAVAVRGVLGGAHLVFSSSPCKSADVFK